MHRMDVTVCKLILLGNGSVGKTSICQRFKDDGFQKVYRQTVGLDFLEKKLEIRYTFRPPADVPLPPLRGQGPSPGVRGTVVLVSVRVAVARSPCFSHFGPAVAVTAGFPVFRPLVPPVQVRPQLRAASVGHWWPEHQQQAHRRVHLRHAGHLHLLRRHGHVLLPRRVRLVAGGTKTRRGGVVSTQGVVSPRPAPRRSASDATWLLMRLLCRRRLAGVPRGEQD